MLAPAGAAVPAPVRQGQRRRHPQGGHRGHDQRSRPRAGPRRGAGAAVAQSHQRAGSEGCGQQQQRDRPHRRQQGRAPVPAPARPAARRRRRWRRRRCAPPARATARSPPARRRAPRLSSNSSAEPDIIASAASPKLATTSIAVASARRGARSARRGSPPGPAARWPILSGSGCAAQRPPAPAPTGCRPRATARAGRRAWLPAPRPSERRRRIDPGQLLGQRARHRAASPAPRSPCRRSPPPRPPLPSARPRPDPARRAAGRSPRMPGTSGSARLWNERVVEVHAGYAGARRFSQRWRPEAKRPVPVPHRAARRARA